MLHDAIQFAKKRVSITRKDKEVNFHTRQSVSFNEREPWAKKEGGSFDVTMDVDDGAEACKRFSIYMLYLVGKK